ncbi:MAG: tRNA preQ1(34) S-adenosylmethionine ribosyltransferase-isomerase QueA [Nitrospirae bacterium]|nr:tRNA preQ1(34) S-adenosylmethionine ribosyltransferase-isomerase QueA [Nitrospirota bacterium]
MRLSEFDYHLPRQQIAQYPLSERDSSRLLVFHKRQKRIEHRTFKEIVEYLQSGDILILNNTKVLPVRLHGKKPTGGRVEVFLIKELYPNTWKALVRGGRNGIVLFKHGISAYIKRNNGTFYISFCGDNVKEILNKIAVMPLPPYIKREADESDTQSYQTVYAEKYGAIAAPTAGLHFTKELLEKIKSKGVEVYSLTLHIGYGTFKPVLVDDIKTHRMEEEFYEMPEAVINAVNKAKADGRRVIAVGTSVTRAIEAYALGEDKKAKSVVGSASIFIYPGYRFKVIDALITNFHLPKSTPIMLASAFTGLTTLKDLYREALKEGYRFFSYGDAMLII